MINANTVIKVRNINSHNPYDEGSPYWNVFIDVFTSAKEYHAVVSDLMKQHDQPLEYYQNFLPVLELDNVVVLE